VKIISIYQKDWLMRQIQMIVQFIARLVWGKDTVEYQVPDQNSLSETDLLYYKIESLLAQSKICEAEDLLYERMDGGNNKYLELAIDFYQKLNKLNDKELENANFSREEIQTGLKGIISEFGLSGLIL